MATLIIAAQVAVWYPKSLLKHWEGLNQPSVCSTMQRFRMTTKPLTRSERIVTCKRMR
jgi:hypothetical protein